MMAKPSGPPCNLGSKCCFDLEKENLYPKKPDGRISDEILETYIRRYIEAKGDMQ